METLWKMGRFSQPQLLWLVDFWLSSTGRAGAASGGHCFINHFPRSVELSHKHRLCENLMRAQCRWWFRVGFWGGMWVKPTNSNCWKMGPSISRCIFPVEIYIKGFCIIFPFAMLVYRRVPFLLYFWRALELEVVFAHGFSTLFVAKKGTTRNVSWQW